MVRPARPGDPGRHQQFAARHDRPQRRALPAHRRPARSRCSARPSWSLRIPGVVCNVLATRPPGLAGMETAAEGRKRLPAAAPAGEFGAGHRGIATGVGSHRARAAAGRSCS
ncbi:MAG: hypothetical protein MZV64_44265 [Ignavibacteriales bacterium]|nr:hypothetical protein [Ignavibacteriales bacterium]